MDSKKRVLMLVPSLGMGGMERVCVNYANLLCAAGYDVDLFNLTSGDSMIVDLLSPSVHYVEKISQKIPNFFHAGIRNVLRGRFRIHSTGAWLKKTNAKKLYRKLITTDPNRYDIEIAFYGGHMIKVISGSIQNKSIKIGWIHSPEIETHFPLFNNEKEAKNTYRAMDILMCVSETVRQRALALFGEDVNAKVLFNPNDTSRIRLLAKEKVDDIQKRKFTFINASRIDLNHKGLDRLINVSKRLVKEGYDFDVWVLGNGKDDAEFHELISKNNLQDVIFALGSKTNPFKYLNISDCYICTSRYEGFSMILSEAVTLGLPIIATDISGVREMLGDSEYGIVVSNDEDGIYEGMKTLLSSDKKQKWIKQQAIIRKDFLSEQTIFAKFEAIMQEYQKL